MKTYGNEKTNLELTGKALEVYSNTDPLTIIEKETDGGFIYDVSGAIEAYDQTAEQVNALLESVADAAAEDAI